MLEISVVVVDVDTIDDVEYFPEIPYNMTTSVGWLDSVVVRMLFGGLTSSLLKPGRTKTLLDNNTLFTSAALELNIFHIGRLQIKTTKIRTPCNVLTILLKTRYFQTFSLPYNHDRINPTNSKKYVTPMTTKILSSIAQCSTTYGKQYWVYYWKKLFPKCISIHEISNPAESWQYL